MDATHLGSTGPSARVALLVSATPESAQTWFRHIEVNVVASVSAARNALVSTKFCLVLVDSALGESCIQLLQQIKEELPDATRVFIDNAENRALLVDAINVGAIEHVIDHNASRNEGAALVSQWIKKSHPVAMPPLTQTPEPENRDSLTGLYNHRGFQEQIRIALEEARHLGNRMSILCGDIDNFAAVNEQGGFRLGDRVLQGIAELIDAETCREGASNVAARFGGQEFAILLRDTDKYGAEQLADKVREAVARYDFGNGVRATISFGVAGVPGDGNSAEELLDCAQSSLQAAKNSGRNRVRVFSPGPPIDRFGVGPEQFATFHKRLGELVHLLESRRTLACIFLDLSRLRRVERDFGITQHTQLFARAGELLADHLVPVDCHRYLLCRTDDADGYFCFVYSSDASPSSGVDLDALAVQTARILEAGLADAMRSLTRDLPQVEAGWARTLVNPMVRSERLIVRLAKEARHCAELEWERTARRNKARLQDIIIHRRVRSHYQPIVDLATGNIFAFEALARGPDGSPLETPTSLFSVADSVDLTLELDRECFRTAIQGASACDPIHRLFLNLLPQSFYDTVFVEKEVVNTLEQAGLRPSNIVFEITERLAIENFTAFRQALGRYTEMGFGVAIDDVGTRHSNLETVMALHPHVVKLSEVLSRGVARSTVKREMVRSLQRIAATIDAVTVAEGIEDVDDLEVLLELGVQFAQGFLFAHPQPNFGSVDPSALHSLKNLHQLQNIASPNTAENRVATHTRLSNTRSRYRETDIKPTPLAWHPVTTLDTDDEIPLRQALADHPDRDFLDEEPTQTKTKKTVGRGEG